MGMRTLLSPTPNYLASLVNELRQRLMTPDFIARHRVRPQDFTRHRQLTFPVIMLFVLQKTVKSIQNHLHAFLKELAGEEIFEPVTAGAVTHARAKLKHTAFIELNEQIVLPAFYSPGRQEPLRRWRGHRLLGIDSSLVRLPNGQELLEKFTVVETSNGRGKSGICYPEARMSVVYDLLNHIGLDARLEPSSLGEIDLAIEQLKRVKAGDVLITDRGFTSYEYLAWHHRLGLDYIARCSTASFAAAQELFRINRANRSIVVKLVPPSNQRARLRQLGLPLELVVRFVGVRLSTGELEVLATSLLAQERYPTEEFLEVYHYRWGHETFYGRMKGRLDLENFSGETVEAVRQDFFASLLLGNLETALTQPAAQALSEQSLEDKYRKQVNHAVAYHAMKGRLLQLLYSELPAEKVVQELQKLFLTSPVSVRPERKPPRRQLSLNRSYHFQRRVRKIVF
jgi:DDE family transposase